MRTNRDGQRRFFVGFTKFAVLLMCFATVFALVLTAGVFDLGSDSSANIAEAASEWGSSIAVDGSSLKLGDTSYSASSTIGGSDVTNFQTYIHNNNSATYTFTLDFDNTTFSASAGVYGWTNGNSGNNWDSGTNVFGFGQTSNGISGVYVNANVTIPGIIKELIKDGYKVETYWTSNLESYDDGSPTCYVGIIASTGGRKITSANDGEWILDSGFTMGRSSDNRSSYSIELTGSVDTLQLCVFRGYATAIFGRQVRIKSKDPSVTFVVTPSTDNNAPVATVDSNNSTLATDIGAYVPSDSSLYDSIVSSANSLKDNISALPEEGGTINLTNAIARAGSISANGNTYGKKLTLTVTDRNVNGGNASSTSTVYYAGVASISVTGNSTVSTGVSYGNLTTASFTYAAEGGGTGNGYVEWTATAARDKGALTIYFSANTASPISLVLSDSGGSSVTYTINVGGIKTEGNEIGMTVTHNTAGWIVTSVEDPSWAWVYNKTLSNILFSNSGASGDPLVWYYTVDKADSPDSFGEVTAPNGDISTWYPFASSTGTLSLAYEFDQGTLGGCAQANNSVGATGIGYYRFTFYAMNYAGFKSDDTVTVYMKVDYTAPENTIGLSYDTVEGTKIPVGDINGDGVIDITESVYVGTSLTANIAFTPNISGNRVLILGADGNTYVVYVVDGAITKITSATDGSTAAGWSESNGVWTASNGTTFDAVNVSLESASDGKIKLTVEYVGKEGVDFAKLQKFTVKNNAQATGSFTDNSGVNGGVSADDLQWTNGAPIYFDMTAPVAPVMSENGGTHLSLTEGSIPSGADRNWYTSEWLMNVLTSVGEDNSYDKVYYLQAYYGSVAAFEAAYNQMLDDYDTKTASGATSIETLLTSTLDVTEDGIDPLDWTFTSSEEVGYYVIYTVGVDVAGNMSSLAAYGVLVDANEYSIGASFAAESIARFGAGENNWTYGLVNANGQESTYKRGETVYFSVSLAGASAYVPYEIKKYDKEGNVIDDYPIYVHPSNNLGTQFVSEGVQTSYVSVDEQGRLALIVDRGGDDITALPAKNGGSSISFSYRQVVAAKFANNQSDYNGGNIEFGVNLYAVADGEATENLVDASGYLPYSVVYPENYLVEGVVHAGKYTLKIARQDSEFYVLNSEVSGEVTINKASIEVPIIINDEGVAFGDVTSTNLKNFFTYGAVSGLVGADAGKAFTELLGANATYSIGTGEGYIPAGTYDTIAAELSATDYDVSFVWGDDGVCKFVIAPRALTVTAKGITQDYGTALPDTYTVLLPPLSAFGFDSEGLYATADEIAGIFGVDASAVTTDESNWVIALPADYFTTGAVVNDFGYVNAGMYDFMSIAQDDLDNNFTVGFVADGNGKIVVNTITVTVAPADGQEFTVDDEDDIAALQVRYDDRAAEIAQFGITGYLSVGAVTAEGADTYLVSDSAANLSSTHNSDGVINVEIAVNVSDITVRIILRASLSGTFTVTFNDNIVFATEYGTRWNKEALKTNFTVTYSGKEGATETPTYDFAITEVSVPNYNFDDVLLNGVQKIYTVTFVYTLTVYTDDSKEQVSDGLFEVVFNTSEGADITNGTRLTVTPKTVSIADAELANNTKVYGYADTALNFTYTFEGLPESYEEQFASLPTVSGIVRYGEGGGVAARYDSVGTYAINYSAAKISDPNLQLDDSSLAAVFGDIEFTITQRELNLNKAILTGENKYYDGTSKANGSINIGSLLVNSDNVSVSFDAVYWSEETGEVFEFGDNYAVKFFNLVLVGEDAGNYSIAGFEELITSYVYKIMQEIIAVNKEHFVVSKTFDGTRAINQSYISISSSSKLWGSVFEYVSGTFHVSDAGSVTIDELQIYFPDRAWIGDDEVVTDYYNLGIDVEVSASGTGTLFTISNLSATIMPLEISPDDIVFDFAMSREYDGETAIDVTFGVTDEFAANVSGFNVSDLGLAFKAATSGKDVGKYIVRFNDVIFESNNYTLAASFTIDGYAALNQKVNGSVTEDGENAPYAIEKKTLTLEIDIPDKVYDGKTDIGVSGITPVVSGLVGSETVTVSADSYTYSDAAGNADPYVQGSADTGYLHYVTVKGFAITPGVGSGFDWKNYTFSSSSVDLEGMPTEGTESYTIEQYLMADAAVISPYGITVTVNNIKVNNKVYDGTTAATLDLSTITESDRIMSIDKDYFRNNTVIYTYNAAFVTTYAHVGTYNVSVSNFGIAIGVDESDADYALAQKIANSYYFAWTGSTSSPKASITPAPLLVEFELPGKTYDGNAYAGIDETKLAVGDGITLRGFVAAEAYASNYNVTVYGAGYNVDDLDVNAERKNSGFVYGFELTNETNKINYYLVFGSNNDDIIKSEGYTQVTELGGLEGLENGYNYYYNFNASTYYIVNATELKALEGNAAFEKLDILAEFDYNKETVYVLGVKTGQTLTDEEVSSLTAGGAIEQSLRRADAFGSIEPVSISFKVNITDSSAFDKTFDDTTTIEGPVYGNRYDEELDPSNYDFTITLTDSLGNELEYLGFEIIQSDISINFEDANVGNHKNVIFAINSIGGGSTGNYIFNTDNNSYTALRAGSVTVDSGKPVTVQLKNEAGGTELSGTYGGTIAYNVSYELNGVAVVVAQDAADGNWYAYVLAEKWNAAFGREGDSAIDLAYVADRLYTQSADGAFALDPNGTWVRLNGTFSEAVPVTAEGNAIFAEDFTLAVGAGTYNNSTVKVSANNFVFNQQSTTVAVAKADLGVTVAGNYGQDGYTFVADYYVGTLPAPTFSVSSGLASVDKESDVLAQLAYSFTLDGKAIDIKTADITDALGDKDYHLKVDASALANYNVNIVDENGESVTHLLLIKLPAFDATKYSVNTSLTKPYQSGQAVTADMLIKGLDASDVAVVDWTGMDGAPVNAGEYTWSVSITRKIDDGANQRGYSYVGEPYTASGNYTIAQRSVIVTNKVNLGLTFDGENHTIDLGNLSATDAITRENVEGFFNDVAVSYVLNGETVEYMYNAGGYTVVLVVGGAFEGNYTIDNRIGIVRVAQAPVIVTVDEQSKTHDVTDGSDGCEITFTAEGVGADHFTVTYRNGSGAIVDTVTTAGVYTYTITSNDPNYYVSGGGTGNLTATISSITYTKEDVDYATIDFGDTPVAINYSLVDSFVNSNTSYWTIVDNNVQQLAGEDEVLNTSGIVNIELTNGNSYVSSLGRDVTVTALMPEGLTDNYRVYYVNANGGLSELTDYTVSGNYITYTTSYISNLVFVNVSAPGLVWWIWPLIAALAILIIAIAILVGVLVKLHRAPDPVPVEVAPIDSIMPEPVAPVVYAEPVDMPVAAADIEPVNYDAPAAVSKHKQPPVIGIR